MGEIRASSPWQGATRSNGPYATTKSPMVHDATWGRGVFVPRHTKRLIDLVVAGTGIVVLAPVMVAVAVVIRVSMGSPVVFAQLRPGYLGRPFRLVKFRSLRKDTFNDGRSHIKERLTPIGHFLRRTSLDELPELFNIVRGDMSLIGPRPLLMEYLALYSEEQARRHLVRPGLTGLAQARGRHRLTWHDRFALDTWYVDNWSLRLDLKILIWTLMQALKGEGVAPADADDYHFTGLDTRS